jgi:ribosomal protein S9
VQKQSKIEILIKVHGGGSTSAATARIRFIREHGRAPTIMEMNDLMHRYNDGTWIKDGLKAQEVAVSIYIYNLFICYKINICTDFFQINYV